MLIKRAFDLFLVVMFSPIWIPLYLICVFILLIFQGRPIHFLQTRVGVGCKEFKLIKFRSMIVDADKVGGVCTSNNDARITKIGGLFRNLSLDELPQLLNVIRGEMSLVGPRPYLKIQKTFFKEEEWIERHKVPPGVTGLAQINGRSNCAIEDRIKFDLTYARRRNLCLDMKIILNTVKIVLKRKGTN